MTHGIKVTNAFSSIQIDSTYANHVYAGGGTVDMSAGSFTNESQGQAGSFRDEQSIDFAGDYDSPPLIFIKLENYNTSNVACTDNCPYGSRHHFSFSKFNRNESGKYTGFTWLASTTSNAHGCKFGYKYFVPVEETTISSDSDGYGLQVRNEAGDIVFDGGYPYLCIVDQLEYKGWNDGNDGNYSSYRNNDNYWDIYFNNTNNNQRSFSSHCGGYYNYVDPPSNAPESIIPSSGFHGYKTGCKATVNHDSDVFPNNTDQSDLWFCANGMNQILLESGAVIYGGGVGPLYRAVMAKIAVWKDGYDFRLSGTMGEISAYSYATESNSNPFTWHNGTSIPHNNITTMPIAVMRE